MVKRQEKAERRIRKTAARAGFGYDDIRARLRSHCIRLSEKQHRSLRGRYEFAADKAPGRDLGRCDAPENFGNYLSAPFVTGGGYMTLDGLLAARLFEDRYRSCARVPVKCTLDLP